jgi:hypothetical protein
MGTNTFINQTIPSTPTTGKTRVYVDDVTKTIHSVDDAGLDIDYGDVIPRNHNSLGGLQGDSATQLYHATLAQLNVVKSTSGANTGDETQATIKTKLGAAAAGVDGYLTGANWSTFNGKQDPNVLTTANSTSATVHYVPFVINAAGNSAAMTNTNLKFYPSTGTFICAAFGIGLSTPIGIIHTNGPASTDNYWHMTSATGTGTTATDGIKIGLSATYDGYINLLENTTLRIYANATEKMSISGTAITFGSASTDTITFTGRMLCRVAASNPQDATPGNRPAGSVGEQVFYSGKMYFCTNAATPLWEKITSV